MSAQRARALAAAGYALMDRKRSILLRELTGLMDRARWVQEQIDQVFPQAYAALQRANLDLGLCAHIAEGVEIDRSLVVRYRSVMGVELPHLPGDPPPPRPEYGLASTSAALDEAYVQFHRVKVFTRELAEVETSIYRLAGAIRKSQKRANALQNIVLPNLDRTIQAITSALEEKEREEFVRLKLQKKGAGDAPPPVG